MSRALDSDEPRVLRTIGRGEGFSGYGLLEAARRTATVRAATRGEVYTLDKGSMTVPAHGEDGHGDGR